MADAAAGSISLTQQALSMVALPPLMARTSGSPSVPIGLVDGPVTIDHADLASARIRDLGKAAACARADSFACRHGTFVAGILCARRSSAAPAIAPDCQLLVRPIFPEATSAGEAVPSAEPEELAAAVVECIDAGARVVNLSAALSQTPTAAGERVLRLALDYAAHRGVLVVAAAGNQSTVGSTAITGHQWVIAVAGCDRAGRPLSESNLGPTIGRRGLRAPGEAIASLDPGGGIVSSGGTSVAAPFVTGAIALAWSLFPHAPAARVRLAIARAHSPRRPTVVPALLDASALHAALSAMLSD